MTQMDWLDYREALGIGFSDQEKVKLFIIKMLNFLDSEPDGIQNQICESEYFEFCNMTGTIFKNRQSEWDEYNCILDILRANARNLREFLAFYIAFLNCQKDKQYKRYTRENYKNLLCNMLNGAHIPYEVKADKDGYFVFPKGAKELDDALVSQPFEWLSDYPNARKTYEIALRQYSERTYIRDVADNLRKTLEAFLQEFLGNEKNLETNKNEICKYLGKQDVDPGIAGLFQSLINAYKNINDRLVKHNDHLDKKLLEFLLYQTGVLIRMVISVKMAEDQNEA